jgi:5-methylcytosine-specific restriction endonuclease McrA
MRKLPWIPRPPRLRHVVTRTRTITATAAARPVARPSIPADTRLFVWNRDGGKCVSCLSDQDLQFDHVIPISRGGANTADNIELLCASCNQRKKARLFVPLAQRE